MIYMDINSEYEDKFLRIVKIAYWFNWISPVIVIILGVLIGSILFIVFGIGYLLGSWFNEYIYNQTIEYIIESSRTKEGKEKIVTLKKAKEIRGK